jgi:hypothetical protein
MLKHISQLSHRELDYAVAKALGFELYKDALLDGRVKHGWWVSGLSANRNHWVELDYFAASKKWNIAGPLIVANKIVVITPEFGWYDTDYPFLAIASRGTLDATIQGDDYLEAAMRCFCVLHLGGATDIPELY